MSAARRFHDATKEARETVADFEATRLDYSIHPAQFKDYPGVEPRPLADELARLLLLGAGLTRALDRPRLSTYDLTYNLRTYSSAGALYPIELYIATVGGLHHFDPREPALLRIREQDVRARLVAGTDAEAVLVLTGIFERSAWKYGARGYRHLWWDAGTLLANLLVLAPTARVVADFADDDVDDLVGADGDVEVALALACVGVDAAVSRASKPSAAPAPTATGYSYGLSRYPEVRAFHDASKRAEPGRDPSGQRASEPPRRDFDEDVFLRRRSRRRYGDRRLPHDDVAAYLAWACARIPADRSAVTHTAVAVHRVAGVEPGWYEFEPSSAFTPIRLGDVREEAAALLMDQEFGGTGAGLAFFLADVDGLDARGYRWAQLESGIRGGRLYLDATARNWGATASTFFDDEVRAALETEDEPMLAVAFGARP